MLFWPLNGENSVGKLNINISKKAGFLSHPHSVFFLREIYRVRGAEGSSGQKREGWTVTFIAVKRHALSFPGHSLTSTCLCTYLSFGPVFSSVAFSQKDSAYL